MTDRPTAGFVVGFVGLGNMGAPMATNVAAAGFETVTFDVAGTGSAASLAEVAARADTVLLSVPDGAASLTVVDGIAAAPDRRVGTVIDLSTVGPTAAREAADRLATVGVVYCDGPVSGGVAGARAGTISVMFGGPAAVFEANRALLSAFAGNVFHVGELAGQGQAMKLLNNFLSATALAASSEALAMGAAFGLDLATMLDVVNVSTGRNTATSDKFPNRVLTGTYDTGFATRLMAKDVRLFNEVAVSAGTSTAVGAAVGAIWDACESAMPASDFSEIWRYVSGPTDAANPGG